MICIMLGAPGTGKGTVASILQERLGIKQVSTGDIFRKNIQEGTKLGEIADSYISKGNLVPDDITIGIVKNRLEEDDVQNGIILDGFPRTVVQAEELDKILAQKGKKVDLVVNLTTPTDEIIERVMARRECPNCKRVYNMILNKPKEGELCDYCKVPLTKRVDDTEEKLKLRLDTFFTQTQPVIDFYKQKGIVKDEEISISINRLGIDAAKDILKDINSISE